MKVVSISQLRTNPITALASAVNFPIQIQNKHDIVGYYINKDSFEKMINYMEDSEDRKIINSINFDNKMDFESFVSNINL